MERHIQITLDGSHTIAIPGLQVTYCSKGIVRRAMQAAGFIVGKLSGPPGKREIVRAGKKAQVYSC